MEDTDLPQRLAFYSRTKASLCLYLLNYSTLPLTNAKKATVSVLYWYIKLSELLIQQLTISENTGFFLLARKKPLFMYMYIYAMLCYIFMLCYAIYLCYAMLCYDMLCYAMLYMYINVKLWKTLIYHSDLHFVSDLRLPCASISHLFHPTFNKR